MVTLEDIQSKVIEVWESNHIVLPSVTAAQFILESASGTSALAKASNNYFGIKASAPWTGAVHSIASNEESSSGAITKPVSAFRKYATWQESVQDHSDFFVSTATRKKVYAGIVGETDYTKACNAMTGSYATDSYYGEKLIAIIEANGLEQWDIKKEDETMTKLIVLGHGNGDPGASGNGTTEATWLRGSFLTSLKKYAAQVGGIEFYESNMFADRTASTITGHIDVTELHLDAAATTASGGHVIVKNGMGTDVTDENLCNVVRNNFGLVPYTQVNRGFSYRDDLLNLNVFATRGISYRLVELCFITNTNDMNYFKSNYDKVAKEIIEAVSGVSIASKTQQAPQAETVSPGTVTASILYLPNGNMWTVYPEGSDYKTGQVISTQAAAPDSGLYLKVLGDKGNNILIVDLPDIGQMAIYFDADKGATITQVKA